MDARETIRRALNYAIQDREAFLASIRHMTDAESLALREETEAELAAFRKMLKRRYGSDKTWMERALSEGDDIRLIDVIAERDKRHKKG